MELTKENLDLAKQYSTAIINKAIELALIKAEEGLDDIGGVVFEEDKIFVKTSEFFWAHGLEEETVELTWDDLLKTPEEFKDQVTKGREAELARLKQIELQAKAKEAKAKEAKDLREYKRLHKKFGGSND